MYDRKGREIEPLLVRHLAATERERERERDEQPSKTPLSNYEVYDVNWLYQQWSSLSTGNFLYAFIQTFQTKTKEPNLPYYLLIAG